MNYPFKTYSGGMKARLGFAVAAHLDPEILLIDEALTGGDAKFKEKTAHKMFELCGDGRTIVIVTHGLSLVRMMATSALWLHQGRVDGVRRSGRRRQRVYALLPHRRVTRNALLEED